MNSTKQYSKKEPEKLIADMAAAFERDVNSPRPSTSTEIPSPMGFGGGDDVNTRPGEPVLQHLIANPGQGDTFLKRKEEDTLSSSLKCNLLRARADALLKKREYGKAAETYLSAAESQCGTTLPPRGTRSSVYMKLEKRWAVEDLVACLTGAGKALMGMGDYAQALFWLQENLSVYRNARYKLQKDAPTFEWFNFHLGSPQHFLQYSNMHKTLSDVYLKLGNTGAACFYLFQAQVCLGEIPAQFSDPAQKALSKQITEELRRISAYHHPEPSLTPRLEVIDDCSQIRGSWKRLEIQRSGGLTNREGTAALVHKGYLYVLGGEKFPAGPFFSDFWRLNLSKMDAWESLPKYPVSEKQLPNCPLIRFGMTVGPDDKAYYFTGNQNVTYFDIPRKEWRMLRTTFKIDGVSQRWPYSTSGLQEFALNCVRGKLYVFGGFQNEANLGCDLLMELDLQHATWRLLSGERAPEHPSFLSPGPRINACSWVSKDQSKIFLMYGDADRLGAKVAGQKHGASTSYAYDDLWSWDISAELWTKEKFVGNGPSPRTEMACAYNPVLDKVITVGGYSPNSPTFHKKENRLLQYSYYADTFMCDIRTPKPASLDRQSSAAVVFPSSSTSSSPSPHRHRHTLDASPYTWRQVLTRGFPTYRAEAHLLVDATSGKTYLFSGYINSEFVPTNVRKSSCSRSFIDIWELRLDLPGGGFEGVNLEEEARTARAGPWQRCFGCGSAGPWKKCGGSCKGRVFFCGSQCLKDGWKEHKEMHGCHKL